MRFLGIGDYVSLGDLYLSLARAGHAVEVVVRERDGREIFDGLLDKTADEGAALDRIRAAGDDGIVIFEGASDGEQADALRREGFRVIGGSAWGDRLEKDRAFGQRVMREAGMQTAATHAFSSFDEGLAFLERHPARYVFKLSDDTAESTRNYVGELDDGRDIAVLLRMERDRRAGANADFVLMEHLTGVEVGIGGYFDGERFLEPAVIDWEHKRFFPGDLGELTGEMGTVVSYRRSKKLFDATLGRIADGLRAARHVGYLNINTIVDERGVWPLEFTSRFGYPGYSICDALHVDGWDAIFRRMCFPRSGPARFETLDGFAVGVVLTVPPFPYEYGYAQLSRGQRIFFRDPPTDAELAHYHYGEIARDAEGLVASGSLGYLMVATGTGTTIADAQRAAYARARNVVTPNLRYRHDIGERVIASDYATLDRLGHLD